MFRLPGRVHTSARRACDNRDDVAHWSDAELVAALRRGDEQALRALYRRYVRPIYALVLRMLVDEQIAEEVVQDTFLRVWRRASEYDPARSTFLTWALGIAHNLAVDELRRRRVRPPLAPSVPFGAAESPEPSDPDPAGDPEITSEVSDARAAIRDALGTLTAVQRAAIELAYFGGLSQSEIAEVTGLPLGTIKSRIRYGMIALQGALAARGFGPSGPRSDDG